MHKRQQDPCSRTPLEGSKLSCVKFSVYSRLSPGPASLGSPAPFALSRCSPLGGKDCIDAGNGGRMGRIGGRIGRIGGQQDRVADDVEWQLAWLGAEQLGLQEGGPLLLQQLFTTHVVLGEPIESQGWSFHAWPCTRLSHWLPGSQPSTRPGADLADSSHPGYVQLLKEVKLAGCLLEEEIDDLGRWDGCHEGGIRCGGRTDRLRGLNIRMLRSPRGHIRWALRTGRRSPPIPLLRHMYSFF